MDLTKQYLMLKSIRRFGAEIEINAFDMLNRPFYKNDLPKGIEYVASLVNKTICETVIIHKWGNDHHNSCWIVKPDGSCGMEVCSPVVKGWNGVIKICKVIDEFAKDSQITADPRCSFHVHVDISDLSEAQIASVITWWVKCEPVFMDAMPFYRKCNEYCQFIGQSDIFEVVEDGLFSNESLIKRMGQSKYYSVNTYHYGNKNRKTMEFRIMDNECCLNPWMAKNWLRLILYFVDRCINKGLPIDYIEGDKWSGYCWLDPVDVFEFLGFYPGQYNLSPGLEQVRMWFLSRIYSQINQPVIEGIFSSNARKVAINQVEGMMEGNYLKLTGNSEEIYGTKYRI